MKLEQFTTLNEPIIENGYGHIFASGFISNGSSYLAIVSPAANKIKTAVFNMDADGIKVKSDIFMVGCKIFNWSWTPSIQKNEIRG